MNHITSIKDKDVPLRNRILAALEVDANIRPHFDDDRHPSYTTLYNERMELQKEVDKLSTTIEKQRIIIDRLSKTVENLTGK